MVSKTASHSSLPEQLLHGIPGKVDTFQGEMLETVEFGDLRNELGDKCLFYVSQGRWSLFKFLIWPKQGAK